MRQTEEIEKGKEEIKAALRAQEGFFVQPVACGTPIIETRRRVAHTNKREDERKETSFVALMIVKDKDNSRFHSETRRNEMNRASACLTASKL